MLHLASKGKLAEPGPAKLALTKEAAFSTPDFVRSLRESVSTCSAPAAKKAGRGTSSDVPVAIAGTPEYFTVNDRFA
jgi:hypothetical protein